MLPAYYAYIDFKVDLEEELRDVCFGRPVIDFSGDEHTPVLRIECTVIAQIPYERIVPPPTYSERFYESTEVIKCLIHDICDKHNMWYHMSTHIASRRAWHGLKSSGLQDLRSVYHINKSDFV